MVRSFDVLKRPVERAPVKKLSFKGVAQMNYDRVVVGSRDVAVHHGERKIIPWTTSYGNARILYTGVREFGFATFVMLLSFFFFFFCTIFIFNEHIMHGFIVGLYRCTGVVRTDITTRRHRENHKRLVPPRESFYRGIVR